MRTMRRVPALTALTVFAAAAFATDVKVRLGDAEVGFDRTRWRASIAHDNIHFEPQGEAGRKLDGVALYIADGATACADLAVAAFALGHYDLTELVPVPSSIGGVDGERFVAHTQCRNATPRGVVVCVKVRHRAYVLRAVNPGCEGRNLFSGIDPIAEIAAGISFADPR